MPKVPPGAKTEKRFQKFVERFEDSDIGIAAFDQRLEQLTDAVNEDGGSSSDMLEPGIDHLNSEWLYNDEIATVTGRVYLASPEVVDELQASLGDVESDENGDAFFFVENAQLISHGIVDGPHGYGLEGEAARACYAFSYPGVESDEDAQLLLYPGNAYRHQYSLPTPEAIDINLHRLWPEEMSLVDGLIKFADDTLKIPRRLAAIARRLSPVLEGSSDFREWLSVYINERVKLAQIWPYYLELENSIHFLDGEADNSWLELSMDKALPLYGRKPRFEFVYSNDTKEGIGEVHAMLFIEIPEDGDEWSGTPIGVDVRNITKMRSTSPLKSLIDKALSGSEQSVGAVMAYAEDEEGIAPKVVEPIVKLVGPERTNHSGDPSYIEEMRLLQHELDSVIKDFRNAFSNRYDTREQALEVAQALTNTIANRLIGAGLGNYMLEFDGPYALRTKRPQEKSASQIEPGEFYLKFDVENIFAKLQHGDTFKASFYGFVNDIAEVTDETTQEIKYTPLTRMVVDLGSNNTHHIIYNLAPLVEINVAARGLVSMDGTVRVTVPSLARYDNDKQARVELADKLPGDSIVGKMNRLYGAFQRESSEGFQELDKLELFQKLVKRLDEPKAIDSKELTRAFEALMLKRKIVIDGSVLDGSGQMSEVYHLSGIVEDIEMNPFARQEHTPCLVMLTDEGARVYVVARSITSLMF